MDNEIFVIQTGIIPFNEKQFFIVLKYTDSQEGYLWYLGKLETIVVLV